jgi:putative hydrolase of the HAD superfamily
LLKAVFFDLGDTLILEQGNRHLGETSFDAVPQAEETLVELKQKGFKLGIIPNTTVSREQDVHKALQRLGLESYFDVIVTSVDAGCEKPDRRIFSVALQALGIKADEAVMIGDEVATDILGGNGAGMITILFKWNQRYPEAVTRSEEQPNFKVRHLSELSPILDRIQRSMHHQG